MPKAFGRPKNLFESGVYAELREIFRLRFAPLKMTSLQKGLLETAPGPRASHRIRVALNVSRSTFHGERMQDPDRNSLNTTRRLPIPTLLPFR